MYCVFIQVQLATVSATVIGTTTRFKYNDKNDATGARGERRKGGEYKVQNNRRLESVTSERDKPIKLADQQPKTIYIHT